MMGDVRNLPGRGPVSHAEVDELIAAGAAVRSTVTDPAVLAVLDLVDAVTILVAEVGHAASPATLVRVGRALNAAAEVFG